MSARLRKSRTSPRWYTVAEAAQLLGRRYLSVAEFAAATGEKPDTVRDRCERGLYRCRKTGSRWRVWAGEIRKQRGR